MGEGALLFTSKRQKDEAERGNRPPPADARQRERLSPGPGWVKGAERVLLFKNPILHCGFLQHKSFLARTQISCDRIRRESGKRRREMRSPAPDNLSPCKA